MKSERAMSPKPGRMMMTTTTPMTFICFSLRLSIVLPYYRYYHNTCSVIPTGSEIRLGVRMGGRQLTDAVGWRRPPAVCTDYTGRPHPTTTTVCLHLIIRTNISAQTTTKLSIILVQTDPLFAEHVLHVERSGELIVS